MATDDQTATASPELQALLEATERKAKAELRRAQEEEKRAAEFNRLRLAEEQRVELLAELSAQIAALITLVRGSVQPDIEDQGNMLRAVLDLLRLLIPKILADGQGEAEVERLMVLLREIGGRTSHLRVQTGDVSAGQDVQVSGSAKDRIEEERR